MTKRTCATMQDWLTDTKKDRNDSGNERSFQWYIVGKDLMVLHFGDIKHCADVAAFDFDGTLVITKSGKIFRENEHDWQFFCDSVPQALTEIVQKGLKVVIFTNQRGIQTGSQDRDVFCRTVEKVCQQIKIPVQYSDEIIVLRSVEGTVLDKYCLHFVEVFVSLGTLRYRKPYIGMWNYFENHGNGGIPVNRQSSFYVGDAAGRAQTNVRKKKDHSAADRLFALNFGINFFTPEQYFLKQREIENYVLPPFSPSSLLDEKVSMFDPENTPVPSDGLEILIFVGYPGCGKSSLAQKLAAKHGYGVVNRDTLKTWQKCVENAKVFLKRQQSVIVDNTNADRESRKRYIVLAKSFGASARCFLFNCTLEQAAHNCKYRVIVDTDEKHAEIGRMVLSGYKRKFEIRRMSSFGDNERQSNGRVWMRKYALPGQKDTAIKYVSLIILVIQNASQVLVMRYVRTRPREMFLSTVAIFFAEVIKLFICILFLTIQEKSLKRCLKVMYVNIIKQPIDTLKVCVPAVIYVFQNNLLYIAVSNLPAATYMVTYQLKILTTALFTVTILRRRLSLLQWLALVLLFGGIALVQLDDQRANVKMMKENVTLIRDDGSKGAGSESPYKHIVEQNPTNGFAAVLVACILSGFAGIYLEKILKGSDVSVWVRNVQLAIISFPVALANVFIQDSKRVLERGMLVGFDIAVWCLILLSSVGGITVAVVIKYADNILKAFAASIAIIVACIASALLFQFRPAVLFLVGTVFVIGAIFMYSLFPYRKKYQQTATEPPQATQEKEETAAV
uniref:Uncharacterized protein n=1 Tax=Setaria digitata TaxID=48799 RepID=A0A915PZT0_9BILA